MKPQRLERDFFARPTPQVARELLGTVLVRRLGDGTMLRGRIVETEAYHGVADTACHARSGLTPRTAVMFGPPGHAYIYLIYGMYSLLNLTANEEGFPGAVLIRALEPIEGLEVMERHRNRQRTQLTNGPGRLTLAMAIDRSLNQLDLTCSLAMWVEAGERLSDDRVVAAPRIGIGYASSEDQARGWRFYDRESPWVSQTVKRVKSPG